MAPMVSALLRDQVIRQGRRISSTALFAWDAHLNRELDLTVLRQWRKKVGPYIFVIGFNKTGTRSLAHFFSSNGLPAVHWDENRLAESMLKNLESGQNVFHGYDKNFKVFTDLIYITNQAKVECNQYFREMYDQYPGAYFILNNRDTDAWIRSRAKHQSGRFLADQLSILGSKDPEVAFTSWREDKLAHEEAVRSFFGNSSHFLELDIASRDIPQKIEDLLGISMDPEAWQHRGRTIG